jgi:cytochrome c oxidase subunit 3
MSEPSQANPFDSPEAQAEAGKLGMWLFLASEVMLFAGLFCAYTVYRVTNPEMFAFASEYLDTTLGLATTGVLIVSAWASAMAVRSAKLGERQTTSLFLVVTLAGAIGFLGIKSVEYGKYTSAGLRSGLRYDTENSKPSDAHWKAWEAKQAGNAEPERQLASAASVYEVSTPGEDLLTSSTLAIAPNHVAPMVSGARPEFPGDYDPQKMQNAHIFWGIFFCITGLLGLHVLVAALVLAWVLLRNVQGEFSAEYNLPVNLAGLSWQFATLVWIFLFPLLYLIG